VTTEQTPINRQKARPIKKRLVMKKPNSSTIDKTEPKTTTMAITMLKISTASHRLEDFHQFWVFRHLRLNGHSQRLLRFLKKIMFFKFFYLFEIWMIKYILNLYSDAKYFSEYVKQINRNLDEWLISSKKKFQKFLSTYKKAI